MAEKLHSLPLVTIEKMCMVIKLDYRTIDVQKMDLKVKKRSKVTIRFL